LGGLNYCDVVSFHPYDARLDWSPVSAEKMIADIKSLMKEYGGEKKELWNTELMLIGKDYYDYYPKGHEMARRFLIDLAHGVSKSFCVQDVLYCKGELVPNLNDGGRETGLIPSKYFVIYNTLTKLFAGSKFIKQIPITGRNKLYVFEKKGEPIGASWSYDDEDKSSIIKFPNAEGKLKFLDMMGNVIEDVAKKDKVLSQHEDKILMSQEGENIVMELVNTPFYIVPVNNISKDEFIKILESAKAEGKTPFTMLANTTYVNDKPAIAMEVRNMTSDVLSISANVKVPNKEFVAKSKGDEEKIPAASNKTIYVSIEKEKNWDKANLVLLGMLGDRIVESQAEVKPKKLAICNQLSQKVVIDGKIGTTEWEDAGIIELNKKEQIKKGKSDDWKDETDCSGNIYLKYNFE
jgi:hypothetical protein